MSRFLPPLTPKVADFDNNLIQENFYVVLVQCFSQITASWFTFLCNLFFVDNSTGFILLILFILSHNNFAVIYYC